ncbi:MAG: GspE/PulE family protein [Nitrospirae bacterium]|nr:GspE/PulE family protein [Nitrospirota bacterium]
MGLFGNAGKIKELQDKVQLAERISNMIDRVYSAENLDEIMIGARDRILSLFDADKIIIFGIDSTSNELYSRFLTGSEIKEMRMPINMETTAGYVAATRQTLNLRDAYDAEELKRIHPDLKFNNAWDLKNGYRTREILAYPIMFKDTLLGVMEVVNKKTASFFPTKKEGFTGLDEKNAQTIARKLGFALKNQVKVQAPTRFSFLLDENIITDGELKKAMVMARQSKKDVETVLMDDMHVKKDDIKTSLSNHFGCKFTEYRSDVPIPGDLLRGLNINYLKKALWVPIAHSNDKVSILIDNPKDIKTTEIKSLIKAKQFEFHVGFREDILRFIDSYEKSLVEDKPSITDIVDELLIQKDDEEEEDSGDSNENAGAIVRLVNQIIIDAFEKGSSDIHVEPNKATRTTIVRLRIDGTCIKHLEIPFSYTSAMVSRLKIMSNLDISERRLPQDGKIKFRHGDRVIELRVATVPSTKGENVVMRILASSKPLPLDEINLSAWNYRNLREIVTRPYGIILVVGPTGSGKTTTLHSILGYINTVDKKIWTAEDPVEISQNGLCQVEVKPKINYTFAAALRSFLRADPDVIMVGEMRDRETATIGVEASLTGHLVFSTLHTNSAPETITRLMDIGIDPFNFADALLGILAQRLVKTLCKKCKEPYKPPKDEFDFLVNAYGGQEMFLELKIPYDDATLYKAVGCDYCNGTGYRGRTGLHELLIGTKEIKMAIQKKSPVDSIRQQAITDGMRILHQDGIAKVFKGFTDYKQVRNVCMVE